MNNICKHYILSLIRNKTLCLITTFLLMFYLWFTFVVTVGYIHGIDEMTENDDTINDPITEEQIKEEIIVEEFAMVEDRKVEDMSVVAQNLYLSKMSELEYKVVDKEKWYLGYKQMIAEFDGYLDPPETVYDVYSADEIYLIQRAVETEVFQCSFDAKVNVASVIFNRIDDGRFGNTVKEVITNPGQFAYFRTKISDSTVLAVEYAFEIEDTTDGCIAFRSDKCPDKWGKWVYRFSDGAVHHFYSEEE